MAWDFSTEPEFQKKLDWVEEFCREEVEPLEYVFPYAVRSPDPKIKALVKGLQDQVKDQGLWAIFLDEELGGPGYGQLKLGLLNEILGRYPSAPQMFGAAAPDTGNMEMLAAYGTDEQKKRWLEPMLNQEILSAYSMTEPQGGSDPNLFRPTPCATATSGSSTARSGSPAPAASPTSSSSCARTACSSCPATTPGVEIQPEPRNHNHIIYNDVRVPLDHLLGPEDGAKVLAQRRLGGGRIHHAMRTIAQCKLAFDMMCERALSRESHGKIIAEHQMVQEKIADSYASIRMLRLFVLETAWKIDNTSTQETRTDIAAVKYTMAKVLREVSFNALHILGSLGTTDLTPLQAMYAARADDGHRRRRRRGAQGDRRPQRAQGLPPARGLLADRVLPGQAREGVGEVRAEVRGRSRAARRWPTATPSTSPAAAEGIARGLKRFAPAATGRRRGGASAIAGGRHGIVRARRGERPSPRSTAA